MLAAVFLPRRGNLQKDNDDVVCPVLFGPTAQTEDQNHPSGFKRVTAYKQLLPVEDLWSKSSNPRWMLCVPEHSAHVMMWNKVCECGSLRRADNDHTKAFCSKHTGWDLFAFVLDAPRHGKATIISFIQEEGVTFIICHLPSLWFSLTAASL